MWLSLRRRLLASGLLRVLVVVLAIDFFAICHAGSSRRDNDPDGVQFRTANLPEGKACSK
jgi:hypothetical protein